MVEAKLERIYDENGITNCFSCGHSYTQGHGLAENDRFCSQRCRDWFDKGYPTFQQHESLTRRLMRGISEHLPWSERRKQWLSYKNVTEPKGQPYYQDLVDHMDKFVPKPKKDKKRARTELEKKLDAIADKLDCSYGRVNCTAIRGKNGFIELETGGRWKVTATVHSSRKFNALSRKLAFLQYDGFYSNGAYTGYWSTDGELSEKQAKTLRTVLGLKKRKNGDIPSENTKNNKGVSAGETTSLSSAFPM